MATAAVPAHPVNSAGSVVGAATFPSRLFQVRVYGVVPPESHGPPVTTTSPGAILERASKAVVKLAAEILNARAEVVCPDHVTANVPPVASTVIVCTSATAVTQAVAVVTTGATRSLRDSVTVTAATSPATADHVRR